MGPTLLSLLEGGPTSSSPLLKCFCWATAPDRSGQHCKEHFSCSMKSLVFLPPPKLSSALLVTGYKLVPHEFLHVASKVQSFLPSCSQKRICQDRHRIESKLLGRFAPSPQCLTVLTYLSLNLQPQPRTRGGTVSPPQVRHGSETTQKLSVRETCYA